MAGNIWGAILTGVISAAQAREARKDLEKRDDHAQDEYNRQMQYQQEQLARRRDSMGARMAPYLMEQMLNVYGNQSKGRGGFTLPIDEILANMHIKDREAGTYNPSSGYGGGYTPYEDKEYELAKHARQQRAAWERNMPTDLGLGMDQIEGPRINDALSGSPTMGAGSEMSAFSYANARPRGVESEDMSNLDGAREDMIAGLAQPHEGGAEVPEWLKTAAMSAINPLGGILGLFKKDQSGTSRSQEIYNQNMQQYMKLMSQIMQMQQGIGTAMAGPVSLIGGLSAQS